MKRLAVCLVLVLVAGNCFGLTEVRREELTKQYKVLTKNNEVMLECINQNNVLRFKMLGILEEDLRETQEKELLEPKED